MRNFFHTQKYSFFLEKTHKIFEIRNFEPQKMVRFYVNIKMSVYTPTKPWV